MLIKNKKLTNLFVVIFAIIFLGSITFRSSPTTGMVNFSVATQPPDNTPKPGIPFEVPGNGSSVMVTPGERIILTTPSGVSVNVSVANNVSISINEITFNPVENIPSNKSSLGKFLQIETDIQTDIDAVLSIPFDDGDLPPGVVEEKLFFAFYNASTREWEGIPSWVDLQNHIVYGQTNHFSTWTVLGDNTNPTTTSQSRSIWADLTNVKDGFVIIGSLITISMISILVVSRRKK